MILKVLKKKGAFIGFACSNYVDCAILLIICRLCNTINEYVDCAILLLYMLIVQYCYYIC